MPRPFPYSIEVWAHIVSEYLDGASTRELADRHGGSQTAVYNGLKRSGVKVRSVPEAHYHLPHYHEAFANAEYHEEAAYWVGVLMADGCIADHKSRGPQVVLALNWEDDGHIHQFRSFLKAEHKVEYSAKAKLCRFVLTSEQLVADLARYGVVPRKSLIAEVRHLELNRHFWRGVVDGDGGLGRDYRNKPTHAHRPRLAVCGSKKLMRQFQVFAHALTGTEAQARPTKDRCWQWSAKSSVAATLISYLYTDCTVALTRKWKLAHELLCEWECRPQRGNYLSGSPFSSPESSPC